MSRFGLPLLILFVTSAALHADWNADVGYTRLQQTFLTGVPTAASAGVSQIEGTDVATNSYRPDAANIQFTGKTLVDKSAGSGTSWHATYVGSQFYGNTSSLVPSTSAIDVYFAGGWLYADYLNFNSTLPPATETRAVQNHSWISTFDRSANSEATIASVVANIDQRLDFAMARDGFLAVVGTNNGNSTSTTLPDLLVQGYHGLSVGLVNGQHCAGLTAYDTPGRMKPDLVSFEVATSYATPHVSGAAALLVTKLREAYPTSLATADYPALTKALLLAGAAKEPLASWSRADTAKPYDARYGAGALNILLSYRILSGGRQTPANTALVTDTGWNVASVRSNTSQANRTYYFEIPAGAASAPFSAALTWHRTLLFSNGGFSGGINNLDLRLYAVDQGTFSLGQQIDASLSTVDNVEHVYQAGLPPGRYALQVSSASLSNTTYALAWRATPSVTIAASTPVARELDGTPGVFTVTRTGSLTSPLLVPLYWGGTAAPGTHYTGAAPSVLIPAGQASTFVQAIPVGDNLAQGDRSIVLSVASDYSLSAGPTASATITLRDKPYDAWRFSRFNASQLSAPSVSGETADPDNDGLPNLLEYAFDRVPTTPDAPSANPVAALQGDHLTLTYGRADAATDVTYTVEWTSDLQTWNTGPGHLETLSSNANGDGTTTVTVRALAPVGSPPRQFMRLRVTRP